MNKTAKTTKTVAAAVACAAIAALSLSACSAEPQVPDGALSAADAYGMGAVSAVKLLGNAVPARAIGGLCAARSVSPADEPTDSQPEASDAADETVKDEIDKFNEYFTAIDEFLTQDTVKTTVENNPDEDRAYEIKMTINGVDINGSPTEYVMYYTETLKDEDVDDDELERKYALVGVMDIDGVEYALEGERSLEQDDKETENELKIRAYADPDDRSTYVQMKQETSVEQDENEVKYVYTVVADGKTIEKTSVKFETETEHGKTEDELSLEFEQGGAKGSYKLSRDTVDGKTCIKVKYDIDGRKGEFHIKQTVDGNGETVLEYTFSDKTSQKFKTR